MRYLNPFYWFSQTPDEPLQLSDQPPSPLFPKKKSSVKQVTPVVTSSSIPAEIPKKSITLPSLILENESLAALRRMTNQNDQATSMSVPGETKRIEEDPAFKMGLALNKLNDATKKIILNIPIAIDEINKISDIAQQKTKQENLNAAALKPALLALCKKIAEIGSDSNLDKKAHTASSPIETEECKQAAYQTHLDRRNEIALALASPEKKLILTDEFSKTLAESFVNEALKNADQEMSELLKKQKQWTLLNTFFDPKNSWMLHPQKSTRETRQQKNENKQALNILYLRLKWYEEKYRSEVLPKFYIEVKQALQELKINEKNVSENIQAEHNILVQRITSKLLSIDIILNEFYQKNKIRSTLFYTHTISDLAEIFLQLNIVNDGCGAVIDNMREEDSENQKLLIVAIGDQKEKIGKAQEQVKEAIQTHLSVFLPSGEEDYCGPVESLLKQLRKITLKDTQLPIMHTLALPDPCTAEKAKQFSLLTPIETHPDKTPLDVFANAQLLSLSSRIPKSEEFSIFKPSTWFTNWGKRRFEFASEFDKCFSKIVLCQVKALNAIVGLLKNSENIQNLQYLDQIAEKISNAETVTKLEKLKTICAQYKPSRLRVFFSFSGAKNTRNLIESCEMAIEKLQVEMQAKQTSVSNSLKEKLLNDFRDKKKIFESNESNGIREEKEFSTIQTLRAGIAGLDSSIAKTVDQNIETEITTFFEKKYKDTFDSKAQGLILIPKEGALNDLCKFCSQYATEGSEVLKAIQFISRLLQGTESFSKAEGPDFVTSDKKSYRAWLENTDAHKKAADFFTPEQQIDGDVYYQFVRATEIFSPGDSKKWLQAFVCFLDKTANCAPRIVQAIHPNSSYFIQSKKTKDDLINAITIAFQNRAENPGYEYSPLAIFDQQYSCDDWPYLLQFVRKYDPNRADAMALHYYTARVLYFLTSVTVNGHVTCAKNALTELKKLPESDAKKQSYEHIEKLVDNLCCNALNNSSDSAIGKRISLASKIDLILPEDLKNSTAYKTLQFFVQNETPEVPSAILDTALSNFKSPDLLGNNLNTEEARKNHLEKIINAYLFLKAYASPRDAEKYKVLIKGYFHRLLHYVTYNECFYDKNGQQLYLRQKLLLKLAVESGIADEALAKARKERNQLALSGTAFFKDVNIKSDEYKNMCQILWVTLPFSEQHAVIHDDQTIPGDIKQTILDLSRTEQSNLLQKQNLIVFLIQKRYFKNAGYELQALMALDNKIAFDSEILISIQDHLVNFGIHAQSVYDASSLANTILCYVNEKTPIERLNDATKDFSDKLQSKKFTDAINRDDAAALAQYHIEMRNALIESAHQNHVINTYQTFLQKHKQIDDNINQHLMSLNIPNKVKYKDCLFLRAYLEVQIKKIQDDKASPNIVKTVFNQANAVFQETLEKYRDNDYAKDFVTWVTAIAKNLSANPVDNKKAMGNGKDSPISTSSDNTDPTDTPRSDSNLGGSLKEGGQPKLKPVKEETHSWDAWVPAWVPSAFSRR